MEGVHDGLRTRVKCKSEVLQGVRLAIDKHGTMHGKHGKHGTDGKDGWEEYVAEFHI